MKTKNSMIALGLAGALAVSALGGVASGATKPAARPTASTGGATANSPFQETVSGSVNPNGSETAYYFQYGLKKGAYIAQTQPVDVGSGRNSIRVTTLIQNLSPATTYHYRIVAASPAGTTNGGDRSFLTPKVPLTLPAPVVAPNPVPYGQNTTLSGTLSGTGAGSRPVQLQLAVLGGYQNVGNPQVTTAAGSFSFLIPTLRVNSVYRVTTVGSPTVTSPLVPVSVSVLVRSHVRSTSRPHRARFFGTVVPGEPGQTVLIQRIRRRRGPLVVGHATLVGAGGQSRFSARVRVTRGIYHVFAAIHNGQQVGAFGTPLIVR